MRLAQAKVGSTPVNTNVKHANREHITPFLLLRHSGNKESYFSPASTFKNRRRVKESREKGKPKHGKVKEGQSVGTKVKAWEQGKKVEWKCKRGRGKRTGRGLIRPQSQENNASGQQIKYLKVNSRSEKPEECSFRRQNANESTIQRQKTVRMPIPETINKCKHYVGKVKPILSIRISVELFLGWCRTRVPFHGLTYSRTRADLQDSSSSSRVDVQSDSC